MGVVVLATAVFLETSFASAETVLYDADVGGACITGREVFVEGRWDFSAYGEFEIDLEPESTTNSWTHLAVEMSNAGRRPADVNGCGSCGIFAINIFMEKGVSSARRPIPPPMPVFQSVVSEMRGMAPEGLFAQIWPSPYWSYKEAGWGNTIKAWSLDISKDVVRVSVRNLGGAAPLAVRRIVLLGPANKVAAMPEFACMPPARFFPCIDVYGQFKWREWPGKVHNDDDLAVAKAAEEADLAAHPGPSGRDKWGGWADGPRFDATGHFYVLKVHGKWWFVDPDGYLWWSHGPVRVSPSCGMTPIKGRERLFDYLPAADSPLAAFYKTRDELLWPYYEKRGLTNTFDFTAANLWRKYGDDWRRIWADRAHKRLRSWGANTIANSSDARVLRLARTPYCDRFEIKSRPIEATAKTGAWWPFRDPFDPSFREDIRRQMKLRKEEMEDPWCFGFFVDNELGWGGPADLARWAWESPEDQPARMELCRRLVAKYGKVPREPTNEDFRNFTVEVIHAYFRGVREEFKRAAPHKLYLGCRFSGGLDETVKRISAEYCDVMSFNYYGRDVTDFPPLPDGVDKPVVIGEFHFGALDRGPIRCGLVWLNSQAERAATYRRYLESALRDPRFVGAHWHQFSDDVATGRFDGENFQIGWVDVCDTPYPETIEAVRWVGENMYRMRYGE